MKVILDVSTPRAGPSVGGDGGLLCARFGRQAAVSFALALSKTGSPVSLKNRDRVKCVRDAVVMPFSLDTEVLTQFSWQHVINHGDSRDSRLERGSQTTRYTACMTQQADTGKIRLARSARYSGRRGPRKPQQMSAPVVYLDCCCPSARQIL
jgi:hypothetical protein